MLTDERRGLSTKAAVSGVLGGRLRSSEGEFPEGWAAGRRQPPERATSDAGGRGAQQEALAILLKFDFLQHGRDRAGCRPFGRDVVPVEAILEFLTSSRQEGAEHVAANAMSLLW